MKMKLRKLLFWALCCALGFFGKTIISPFTNLLSDIAHIPGGIGTAFSLMFLVVAAECVPRFGCCALMGLVQSLLAIAMGRLGAMGMLSPLGYILPGMAIDLVLLFARGVRMKRIWHMALANTMASVTAALTANLIVFRLSGIALFMYLGTSALCGAVCGLMGSRVARLAERAIGLKRGS